MVADISFDMVADPTDDPVLTVTIRTPAGMLVFMAEAEEAGNALWLRGVHVQGIGPNAVGAANLSVLAQAVLEGMGFDGLVVEGAVRTTGANPGRRPRIPRFARRVRSAAGSGPRHAPDH